MRPHEEEHRRREDQTLVARVSYSPWANIANLGGTAVILVALVTFGGTLYSNQKSVLEATDINTQSVTTIRKRISSAERQISSLQALTKFNQQQIERVEERAQSDRKLIINRLKRVDSKLDRLIESQAGDGGP